MAGWKPTKVCPTCGHEYGDDALFCMKDGTKTVPVEAEAADEAAAEEAARARAKEAALAAMQHATSPALIVDGADAAEEPPAPKAEPSTVVDPPNASPPTSIEPATPRRKREPEQATAPRARTPMDDWADPAERKKKTETPPAAAEAAPLDEELAAAFEDGPSDAAQPPKKPQTTPQQASQKKLQKRKKKASSGGSAQWGGALSRFRNPWMAPLAKDAPTGIEGAVKAARRVSRDKPGDKPFSDTLWFLQGAKPEAAKKLEEAGAAEVDDGHYEKKQELPDAVRERYSLEAS